jgi:hypothetical protein
LTMISLIRASVPSAISLLFRDPVGPSFRSRYITMPPSTTST